MKLAIITALWGRHRISEACLSYMATVNPPDTEVIRLAVGSEGAVSRAIAEGAGYHYLERRNRPLGRKWNAVSVAAKKYNPDALMVIGSDDVVNVQYVSAALKIIQQEEVDYTCIPQGYMYDWTTGRTIFLKARVVIGSGRMFSRRLCEKLNWRLWKDGSEDRMDASCDMRIREKYPESDGFTFKPCSVGDILIVKEQSTNDGDGTNIWSFEHIARRTVWLESNLGVVEKAFPGLFDHEGMRWYI